MSTAFDEGIRIINDVPLPVDCQIQEEKGIHSRWVGMHYHEYIEILYSFQGETDVMLDGDIIRLQEGAMFVINANEPHSTRGANEGERLRLCIKFMPQVLYSSQQTVTEMEYSIPYVFENFGKKRLFPAELLEGSCIPEEFKYIYKEKKEEAFGYELAIRSGVLRIFSWIMRYWHDNAKDMEIPALNSSAARMVRCVREYVEQNYAEATLEKAANVCGLSYSYFSRAFHRYMKMSFSDYVNLVRVNQSLKYLAMTDMSITEVALSVGFSTTSYYIQVFKKLKNISPNSFRKLRG